MVDAAYQCRVADEAGNIQARNIGAREGDLAARIVLVQLVDGVGEAPARGKCVLAVEIDGLFGVDTEAIIVEDRALDELHALRKVRSGLDEYR